MDRTGVRQGKEPSATILIVGRNRRNLALLQELLEAEGYQVLVGEDLTSFARVAEETPLSLALVDLAGFDQSIWGPCERLRSRDVPFLLFSPKQSAAIQEAGLSRGARGVLVKPVKVRHLLALVRELLAM